MNHIPLQKYKTPIPCPTINNRFKHFILIHLTINTHELNLPNIYFLLKIYIFVEFIHKYY